MVLKVIDTGSKGNCYLLENEHEALIIELGVKFQKVKEALNFDLRKIVGALCSHEHLDHSRSVAEAMNSGIDVIMSKGTAKCIRANYSEHRFIRIQHGQKLKLGNFTIMAFNIKHDCNEPLGFLIKHPETGLICFLTDSYYIEYTFPHVNNYIIEANFCEEIIRHRADQEQLPNFLMNRIFKSHMSIQTCKQLLLANDLTKVNNIVLIHLSEGNSHAANFQRDITDITGKQVHVAAAGLVIDNFGPTPF